MGILRVTASARGVGGRGSRQLGHGHAAINMQVGGREEVQPYSASGDSGSRGHVRASERAKARDPQHRGQVSRMTTVHSEDVPSISVNAELAERALQRLFTRHDTACWTRRTLHRGITRLDAIPASNLRWGQTGCLAGGPPEA